MTSPLLQIAAVDIETSGRDVDVVLPAEWLARELADTDVGGAGPAHFTGRLSRSGADIVVRGHVTARVSVPCARCLAPTFADVDGELSLLLKAVTPEPVRKAKPSKPSSRARAARAAEAAEPAREPAKPKRDAEYEFTSAEAELDVYDGETVVLDPFVREAILLEVPNFPLCSDACAGIPRGPSEEPEAEGSIDPRLSPLAALRSKLTSSYRTGLDPAGTPSKSTESSRAPAKPAGRSTENK
jgi:uncharacterized protein